MHFSNLKFVQPKLDIWNKAPKDRIHASQIAENKGFLTSFKE